MRYWRKITDELDQGKKVEDILKTAGFSKREISRLKFKNPGILLDGRSCRSTCIVKAGQEICLYLDDEKKDSDESVHHLIEMGRIPKPEEILEILYEDDDLLVVNKPSGLSCHPGRGHYQDNLGMQIQNYCLEKKEICQIRLIGRLDKDTSGLVVYAKNQAASARLWKQREQGLLQKRYLVLVHGVPEPGEGSITALIAESLIQKSRMQVSEGGKYAETFYRVQKCFRKQDNLWKEVRKNDSDAEISLIECSLKTGRTHQIRVHMAYIGHPVLGDSFYGNTDEAERLCLHAWSVTLYQPFTNEKIHIELNIKGIPF